MAAALALAQAGRKVCVLEQHSVPGGFCQSFTLGGFRFSPGIHYIGDLQPGGMFRRALEGLGVSEHLAFFEMNRDGYDHVLHHVVPDAFPDVAPDMISGLVSDADAVGAAWLLAPT